MQKYATLAADTKNNPNLKGVWFEKNYIRTYPYGSLASPVIGFTRSDNVGSGAAVLADILNYLWEDKRQTRKDILLYNEENICDYDRFGPVWMEYYPSPKRGN